MKKLHLLLFTFLYTTASFSGTITSISTGGNWSNGATWIGGVVPVSADDVIVANGATVTIDANVSCNTLTVGQGTSGKLQFSTSAARTLTVAGNIIINNGATLTAGTSGSLTHSLVAGGSISNNGTFTASVSSNTISITFNSTAANQIFSNAGTITSNELRSLTVNNTFGGGTVTIPSGLSMASGSTLTLSAGILNIGTGGTGSFNMGTSTSGTFSCTRTLGSMVAGTVAFGTGVTTKTYTYNGAATQTTGAELTTSTVATINVLTINNPSLNLSLDKAVNVITILSLTAGIVNTTTTNLLTLGTAGAGVLSGASAISYINGPFARTFSAQVAAEAYSATTLFPVGKSGSYMPAYLDPNVITGTVQLKAEAFTSNTGTNASGFLANKRWDISQTTGGVNLTNVYLRVADASVAANYSLLKSPTPSGAYTSVSTGTAAVAGATLTSIRSIPVNELSVNASYSYGIGNTLTAPGGIQGAVMWFKADAGATVSAGKVTNWANQTPFITNIGNLSKQATGNIFYDASRINYNPSFGFDGTQYLASGGIDDIPYTVLVNGKRASSYCVALAPPASTWASFYGYQAIPSVTNKVSFENSKGIFQGTSATGFSNFPTAETNLPSIYSFVKGSTSNTAYLNGLSGTPVTSSLTVYSTPITYGTFNIMGFKNGAGCVGDLQEIIFFDGTSSAIEKTKIESYLSIKYGITINNNAGGSAGDLLLSDGSMAWDASDNAAYHKQVVGLAKDDVSALLQKQSHTTDDSLRVFVGSLSASNQSNAGAITNNLSSIIIGNDRGGPNWSTSVTKPASITSRLTRTFKVTNNNFSDNFSIEIKCDTIGGVYSLGNLRFLVSSTPDFSSATVYAAPDVTFAFGSIIVNGISNSVIPANSTRYITVGLSLVILPIELSAFNAYTENNSQVIVTWKINTASYNPYFTIQKSADGENWMNVTTIKGNADQPTYATIDNNPLPGVSYYRLQQTSADNTYRYSEIKTVRLHDKVTLNVYPNPTSAQVVIEGTVTELSQLKLFSVTGQDVTGQMQVISKNGSKIILNLSPLSKGIYMMKTNTTVTKLFKQ